MADMMPCMTSTGFQAALSNCALLSPSKLSIILDRIASSLSSSLASSSSAESTVLSQDESKKLCRKTGMTSSALSSLLSALVLLLESAAFNSLSPSALSEALASVLPEEQTVVFEELWAHDGKAIVANLREAGGMCAPRLCSTDWRVLLDVAKDGGETLLQGKGRLELTLTGGRRGREETEVLGIEVGKEDAAMLFEQFEMMQSQIDALGN